MSIGIRVVSESHKATAGFPVVSDPADPPAAQVPVDASNLLPANDLTVTLSVDQGASASNTVDTGEAFLVDSVDVEVVPMVLGARDARADGFAYDEAGRMVLRTVDGVSTALVWDVMSNLVESDGAGGHVVYVYDASGQRVAQVRLGEGETVGSATAYVGGGQVTDPNTSMGVTGDTTATRYYTFGGATVAVRTDDGQLALMLGDEQGSTSVMMPVVLDGSGAMVPAVLADAAGVVRTAYTPYGQLRGADNVAVDRGWLGQVEDTGTGLTYLNARYYDPALQRFLSPDPLMNPGDPRTLDAYRYAENNPVVFTDASGLCSTTGNWAYVGGVLEPPCNKSNGKQYAAAAPATPDVFHGDIGWRQTGGAAGAFPNDAPKTMRENIDNGMVYLGPGGPPVCGGGASAYACMFGALPNPVGVDYSQDRGHGSGPSVSSKIESAIQWLRFAAHFQHPDTVLVSGIALWMAKTSGADCVFEQVGKQIVCYSAQSGFIPNSTGTTYGPLTVTPQSRAEVDARIEGGQEWDIHEYRGPTSHASQIAGPGITSIAVSIGLATIWEVSLSVHTRVWHNPKCNFIERSAGFHDGGYSRCEG